MISTVAFLVGTGVASQPLDGGEFVCASGFEVSESIMASSDNHSSSAFAEELEVLQSIYGDKVVASSSDSLTVLLREQGMCLTGEDGSRVGWGVLQVTTVFILRWS